MSSLHKREEIKEKIDKINRKKFEVLNKAYFDHESEKNARQEVDRETFLENFNKEKLSVRYTGFVDRLKEKFFAKAAAFYDDYLEKIKKAIESWLEYLSEQDMKGWRKTIVNFFIHDFSKSAFFVGFDLLASSVKLILKVIYSIPVEIFKIVEDLLLIAEGEKEIDHLPAWLSPVLRFFKWAGLVAGVGLSGSVLFSGAMGLFGHAIAYKSILIGSLFPVGTPLIPAVLFLAACTSSFVTLIGTIRTGIGWARAKDSKVRQDLKSEFFENLAKFLISTAAAALFFVFLGNLLALVIVAASVAVVAIASMIVLKKIFPKAKKEKEEEAEEVENNDNDYDIQVEDSLKNDLDDRKVIKYEGGAANEYHGNQYEGVEKKEGVDVEAQLFDLNQISLDGHPCRIPLVLPRGRLTFDFFKEIIVQSGVFDSNEKKWTEDELRDRVLYLNGQPLFKGNFDEVFGKALRNNELSIDLRELPVIFHVDSVKPEPVSDLVIMEKVINHSNLENQNETSPIDLHKMGTHLNEALQENKGEPTVPAHEKPVIEKIINDSNNNSNLSNQMVGDNPQNGQKGEEQAQKQPVVNIDVPADDPAKLFVDLLERHQPTNRFTVKEEVNAPVDNNNNNQAINAFNEFLTLLNQIQTNPFLNESLSKGEGGAHAENINADSKNNLFKDDNPWAVVNEGEKQNVDNRHLPEDKKQENEPIVDCNYPKGDSFSTAFLNTMIQKLMNNDGIANDKEKPTLNGGNDEPKCDEYKEEHQDAVLNSAEILLNEKGEDKSERDKSSESSASQASYEQEHNSEDDDAKGDSDGDKEGDCESFKEKEEEKKKEEEKDDDGEGECPHSEERDDSEEGDDDDDREGFRRRCGTI